MIHLLREVRTLRQEGKLHKKLISQVRMLFIISCILGLVVVYNILLRGADIRIALFLACIGSMLGISVFSRISVVNWNEDEEIVQLGKMDKVGYATIILYIVFDIGLRTYLKDVYPVSATAYLLAAIFGTLFGRSIGTIVKIHGVYRTSRTT